MPENGFSILRKKNGKTDFFTFSHPFDRSCFSAVFREVSGGFFFDSDLARAVLPPFLTPHFPGAGMRSRRGKKAFSGTYAVSLPWKDRGTVSDSKAIHVLLIPPERA
jgi:hypothetical protein